jgi:hypothetical protein
VSVNKDLPHFLVLPEDDATRQIATGFRLDAGLKKERQMDLLRSARGWLNVLEVFKSDYVAEMNRYPTRLMILLLDFDGRVAERLEYVKTTIPPDLEDRVFILGASSEPEDLRIALGLTYEEIGLALAEDCREETDKTWGHDLLQHNESELARLRPHVRRILFELD